MRVIYTYSEISSYRDNIFDFSYFSNFIQCNSYRFIINFENDILFTHKVFRENK